MNISSYKNDLLSLVHQDLYGVIDDVIDKKQVIKELKDYLNNSKNVFEDLRILLSSRNNEDYLAYNSYIEELLKDTSDDNKIELIAHYKNYEDIIKDWKVLTKVWETFDDSQKIDYLISQKSFSELDIYLINQSLKGNNYSFLNEIINQEKIFNNVPNNSLELTYSINLLNIIDLNDYNFCKRLTKRTFTTLLSKKSKSFFYFKNIYLNNKKILDLIERNSLVFDTKDNKQIYDFVKKDPILIGKLNIKYLNLFNIMEIIEFLDDKKIDSDSYSSLIQQLYKYEPEKANEYFNIDSLSKCSKHSIEVSPFESLDEGLRNKIFDNYNLFNKFIDTIVIETINNYFEESDILNILRNDSFINEASSYSLELLLNKLDFKSSFNMLQRKCILDRINNLNVKISEEDSMFIKGYLDSPLLVSKSDHIMLYEMLTKINKEEFIYYINLPYILNKLNNTEIINLSIYHDLKINQLLDLNNIFENLLTTDIVYFINASWEKDIDLSIFLNDKICKKIFNLDDKQYKKINFEEVNYLFETIRMKTLLSKQNSKITVLTYKSVLASYLVLGLDRTINLVVNGDINISLDDVKKRQKKIIDEKILLFKENNSTIFQNMSKKIINNLNGLGQYADIYEFTNLVRKNTYLDNILYLMLNNNYDNFNNIINTFYSYKQYSLYDKFESRKDIYDYTNDFIDLFIKNKEKEYNKDFEAVVFENFKVKEKILYSERTKKGKEFLKKLKLKIFVRALTDNNKDIYIKFFDKGFDIHHIKEKYLKYLGNENIEFEPFLEHVLIPLVNNRFDEENCLNKLNISKPDKLEIYNNYLKDLENVTKLNSEIDYLKEFFDSKKILSIMNYICYGTDIDFKIKVKTRRKIEDLYSIAKQINNEIYIDKSVLKYIYNYDIDIYNLDELIEYKKYQEILEDLITKTYNYVNRHILSSVIKVTYANDYLKEIDNASYVFPITNKYYEPKKRVFSMKDIEKIFNGFEIDTSKKTNEELIEFLLQDNNIIMIADGYYNGVVDNLGTIITNWDKIRKYFKGINIKDISIIDASKILALINYDTDLFSRSINKDILMNICDDGYYEVLETNERIKMISNLYKETFKQVRSSVPYINYVDEDYEVKVIDKYSQEILTNIKGSLYNIGMVGNDFLHYSILNKNGFQVGIYKNNILVAKLLGVRNGNVICLNEIEGVKDNKYYDLLRRFADLLIKETQECSEPIEYVTIVNNYIYNSQSGIEIDNTICQFIDNPINTSYGDYETFKEYKYLIDNDDNLYTSYNKNVSTLLASSNIVDINNIKSYDTDAKYMRNRNSVVKLSNNIGEDYLNKINTIISLYKEINPKEKIEDIKLSDIETIYLGDDFVFFIKNNGDIQKYSLLYDSRAIKEINLILESIK